MQSRRHGADVELRALKAHLEGQAVHPAVLAGACGREPVSPIARPADGADALDQHQRADRRRGTSRSSATRTARTGRSGAGFSRARTPMAEPTTPPATSTSAHLDVDVVAPVLGNRAGHGGGDDLHASPVPTATAVGTPMKIRSGVSRKPPPTPNRPDRKPTAPAHAQEHQDVHGHLGNGQVDVHQSRPAPNP